MRECIININNDYGPRGFGLTENGRLVKALLAIGHWFKSPVGT